MSRLATVVFLVLCALTAYGFAAGLLNEPIAPIRFFVPRTLALAALFALALTAVLRSPGAIERVRRLARDDRLAVAICSAIAIVFTADWLLRAINFDGTVGNAFNLNLIEWELSEPFAILNGRTMLVDFHALYGHLWAYVGAGAMRAFGATLGTWTTAMSVISGLAMLSVFAVLRRLTRSAVLALAMYLPVLAMAYWVQGSPSEGTSIAGIFSIWPLRCAGPFLLAWLTARHLDGSAPRRTWLLFLAGGLVLINNVEFGLGALAGTCVAVLLARPQAWRRSLGALGLGALAAAGLVSLLTLVRAGALPDFAMIFEFPRLFGVEGWGLLPMPTFGLHVLFYGTYVAAISLAIVRALRREPEQLLTGMLGWAGTFGLLAGSYYVGRSEPGTLLCLFPPWIFALVLLLIAVVQAIARAPRLPTIAELAVMFAFGLAIAALPNTPLPWAQVDRLQTPAASRVFEQPTARAFVAQRTSPGEHVAILALLGHRVAHDLGLVNVSPFSTVEAIRTPGQLALTVNEVQRHDVQAVFVRSPESTIGEELGDLSLIVQTFASAGFSPVTQERDLIYLAKSSG